MINDKHGSYKSYHAASQSLNSVCPITDKQAYEMIIKLYYNIKLLTNLLQNPMTVLHLIL